MLLDDIAALISESASSFNEYRQETKQEIARQVFCKKDRINRAEFFGAGRQGLNPEFKLIVSIIDYHGESVVQYKDKRYGIYRTYELNSDYIELYCEEKGGVQA